MEFVTVIIPTYNRLEDLLKTLPQIVKFLDANSELIIFDQSDKYDPNNYLPELKTILSGINSKYIHCDTPSVPFAWNTTAKKSKGDIILFLDDDIDVDENIIELHRAYYSRDPEIVGVAGCYYAASYQRPWVPSSRKGSASTLAGVNVSFRKDVLLQAGAASNFIRPFAPFDWEIAEHIVDHFGRIAVGSNIFVFHRAPANGGCENQAKRGVNWYYGCYHNHFLWILHRKFPLNFLRLPRHVYSLIKYCTPKRELLFQREFWSKSVKEAIKNSWKTYKNNNKERKRNSLHEPTSIHQILETQAKN